MLGGGIYIKESLRGGFSMVERSRYIFLPFISALFAPQPWIEPVHTCDHGEDIPRYSQIFLSTERQECPEPLASLPFPASVQSHFPSNWR